MNVLSALVSATILCVSCPLLAQDTSLTQSESSLADQQVSYQAFKSALEATYQNNPRIIAERKTFEQTGEEVNQALSGWLPSINLNYQRGRQRNRQPSNTAGGRDDWNYIATEDQRLDISQPILRVDTYYDIGRANNTFYASGSQLISVTQNILLNAIGAYIDVVRDREILGLSQNNERVLEQHLGATRDRFDVGEATRTDVSQSEARLSRSEADTIQSTGSVAIAEAAFSRITGLKADEGLAYPKTTPPIPATLEEAINVAQALNPRILSAKYTEEAADDAIGTAKAALLPTARVRGTMSRAKGAFTGIDFDSDSVLVDVSLPLYQGGAQYSRVRAAKSDKSRRRYELMETMNEVRQQTVSAWEQYVTEMAAIESQKDTIVAAEVALDGVQQERLYGTRTVLDVLDAEQELFAARVDLARSERDRLFAVYNLLSILGQLSPQTLQLGIDTYDTEAIADEITYQFIGF